MTAEPTRRSTTSRVVAGSVLAFLFGAVAYAVVSTTGWGGMGTVALAAGVGFAFGFAIGLFLTEVLVGLFS